jgi:hypothetical protein
MKPDPTLAADLYRQAEEAVARGDGLLAAILRARAACTASGKVLPPRRAGGWLEAHERSQDAQTSRK